MELENTIEQRKGFYRKNVSARLHKLFEEADVELTKFNVEIDFINFTEFIVNFLPKDLVTQFVEINIPLESKLKLAMEDPELRDTLSKMLEKHSKSRK